MSVVPSSCRLRHPPSSSFSRKSAVSTHDSPSCLLPVRFREGRVFSVGPRHPFLAGRSPIIRILHLVDHHHVGGL
ncbi:hypothetical protein ACLOJK_014156 [Asimina triloba]